LFLRIRIAHHGQEHVREMLLLSRMLYFGQCSGVHQVAAMQQPKSITNPLGFIKSMR
jgi:hypothetical protein